MNHTFELERTEPSSSSRSHPLTNNPFADRLDHLNVTQTVDAWSGTLGKETVKIGVVDTGFYLNHPDLAGQFWVNEGEDITGEGRPENGNLNDVDDDRNGYVDDVIGYDFVDRSSPLQRGEFEDRDPDPSADPERQGSAHGTSVAAIATAAPGANNDGIAGGAPNTRLVALRAFGGDGIGESDDIAAAIAYAAETNVDVLNLSFGRSRAVPLIRDAIHYANERGVVVVASAGNELTDDPHYPSDHPEVISVAWLAEDGDGLPSFNRSQFGIGVDIGAPGSDVFTADFPASVIENNGTPTEQDLYQSSTGSSFSAPQVAGAAALLRSADSSLSPASVRSILTATANDLSEENWDHRTGAGLLNVNAALARAHPARTEIDRPDHNDGIDSRSQQVVPVVGTAIDPSFAHYSVSYAEGTSNLDARSSPWTVVQPSTEQQVLQDTLTEWSVEGLSDGEYTLRLVTTLRDGRTIEDRRRVILDRSKPKRTLEFIGVGRTEGHNGLVADIATDDRTRLRTIVQQGGTTTTTLSERVARRHSVTWADEEGRGGSADITIKATNRSGLTTSIDTSLQIPPAQENTALLRRTATSVPRGTLLPVAPDFDGDGLAELVLNQSREGGRSDTLRSFEWMGEGFAPAGTARVPFVPRDVGDTDGNNRDELLLQSRRGTLLLEQKNPTGFPEEVEFDDTVGDDTPIEETVSGVRLTDLDDDGKGEILATDGTRLELLERETASSNSRFQSVLQLPNPTSASGGAPSLANRFDTPNVGTGDFDNDGNQDLLAGDQDGDLVVFESAGDDQMNVVWTHETDRVDAGNRFAVGNLTGGPASSFVTATTSSPRELDNGEFEAQITHYSVWTSVGADEYARDYRLPIAGPFARRGAMTAADLDDDGRDEVVIAHAPSFLVLDYNGGEWRVRYQNEEGLPLQTRRLVAADFTGSGHPSIIAESAGEQLVRFAVNEQSIDVAPPQWTSARAGGATSAELTWTAAGADSVTVYGGPPDGALDSLTVAFDSSYVVAGSKPQQYALRAWRQVGGESTRSPLSSAKMVRPHPPATVTSVDYPSPTSIRLSFSEPLRRSLEASTFTFGASARSPDRLVQTRQGSAVVLHFSDAVVGQSAPLRWADLRDRRGLSLDQTEMTVSFPDREQRSLYIEQATILDETHVRLQFNEPLDPAAATEQKRYELQPRGQVASIQRHDDDSIVTLRVEGLVLGPSGEESSLEVSAMKSADGNRLADEGTTVRLTTPAEDLSNVFVYPNPYRDQSHSGSVTIAGLPREATIRIYSPDGRLVRTLSVDGSRDGGTDWDLRDRRGESVPSGVYLFRVNAPNQSPVLEKAAVIQ